jgi:hypothetical protein
MWHATSFIEGFTDIDFKLARYLECYWLQVCKAAVSFSASVFMNELGSIWNW